LPLTAALPLAATIASVRFPVVLFDLDGTLIDSGPIIVASMKHAAATVLGREVDERLLTAAIGGPGLVAQMRSLDPDRVDELVDAYREHNEPLHDELEAFWEVVEVLPRLRAEGRRLGIVTAKRRATVQLAFDRLPGLEESFDVLVGAEEPDAFVDRAEDLLGVL
jgi:pyrophosphatase PpaX